MFPPEQGRDHSGETVLLLPAGSGLPDLAQETESLPLQEGDGDMSVQLQQHNPGSEIEQGEASGVPGGSLVHPQHQRHEGLNSQF